MNLEHLMFHDLEHSPGSIIFVQEASIKMLRRIRDTSKDIGRLSPISHYNNKSERIIDKQEVQAAAKQPFMGVLGDPADKLTTAVFTR